MSDGRPPSPKRLHEAAWPDMLANLQTAYAELAHAKFEIELRAGEIEETRDLFQRVIESMSEALVLTDPGGRVVRANPSALTLLECEEGDLVNRTLAEVCGSDEIPATPWQLLHLAPGGTLPNLEAEVRTRAGRRIAVSTSCGLVRDKRGKVIGMLAVMRDIRDRKRAEEERARLLASAQAARAEAETANQAKDEFLATLSHELRTPLSAILGWARMLRTMKLDQDKATRALETIERNARLQAQLVEDVLDVSRIVTGKLRLDVRLAELRPIIEAALDVVRPAADAKAIRLEFTPDSSVGPIAADPDRLQQVIWNLLSNGVKFTPHGGRIEIRLENADTDVRITVSDTGQGISPDFLPSVFERFRQADSTAARAHGGLGLGLAIVRHLVELHGGTVLASSKGLGQGATFTVNLPLMGIRTEPPDPSRPYPILRDGGRFEAPSALSGLRILVVDDEPDSRELFIAALEGCGAEVIAAASVTEALEALERLRPDVLVSDIGMPGVDGYDLIRRVRALESGRGKRLPALALTAYARPEDRARALAAGFDRHAAKPAEPGDLVKTVAAMAGRIASPQGGREGNPP